MSRISLNVSRSYFYGAVRDVTVLRGATVLITNASIKGVGRRVVYKAGYTTMATHQQTWKSH